MTDNVTPIRKPESFVDALAADKVTKFAQRLGVEPCSVNAAPIGFPGNHGETYSLIDLMIAFLDKIEAAERQ